MSRQPSPFRGEPSLRRAILSLLQPLLLRPFLWMCASAMLGVVLGGGCARAWNGLSREEAPLLLLLPFFAFGLGHAFAFRRQAWGMRAGVALAIVSLFALHTARRLLPPQNDVSRLLARSPKLDGPLRPFAARVVGIIGDYPNRSRWNVRFPLEVETVNGHATKGRMWTSVPFDERLEVGDRIEFETDIRPLARPANPGEKEAFWSQIGARCWCENGPVRQLNIGNVGAAYALERRVQVVRRALLARYETLFGGDEDALVKRPFPRQNAALLTAMVWGESGLAEPLPEQTRADFRAAGLSHLLVASGTQVTFIFLALVGVSRVLRLRRVWLVVFVVPGLIGYALVAGAAPSIWRATAFGILGALCLASGRDLDGLSLWSAALLGLLLLDPSLAWSLSFQFTFAAVWGLLVLAPVVFEIVKRLSSGMWGQLASMSLGAQAAIWPLSLLHFGTSSAAGLGANFLAVPLAGILVFAGALGLVLPIGEPLYRLTDAVSAIAQSAAHPFGALVEGVSLSTGWAGACYSLFLLAALPFAGEWDELREGIKEWFGRQRANVAVWNPKIICTLLGLSGVALTVAALRPAPRTLRVTVLDVGQGQCVVIQDPSGRAALVDGGSLDGKQRADVGASVIVPALRSLGVERLDYVIVTSPDDDHCNGLRRVLREIPVGAFVDGPRAGHKASGELWDELGQAELSDVRREVERQKLPVLVPRAGEVLPLGESRLRVLNPLLPLGASQNDNALALRLEWNGRSVLMSSDLERAGEKRLVQRAVPLNCDVLLVSRHGANTSSSPDWLRASAPGAAVVSCGRFNRLNVPSPPVLRELSKRKIPLFRTDLDGALGIECGASECRITPQNP